MQGILKRIDRKHRLFRILEMIMGVFIMASAFNLFILPNDIVSGGVSGLSLIIKKMFGMNPSLFMFISSMLLLVVSFLTLGVEKTKHSILGSILFPIAVSLTTDIGKFLNIDTTDQLLLVLFGGVIYGFGVGLVFKAGFTTGGTDILNQIVCKYCKTSLGTSMLLVDGFVVLLGGIVFGWTKFMYALMLLYIISILTDKVLLGISDSKAFYIVTEKQDLISEFVINDLHHTVTVLDAKGGFTKTKNPVLFAVIPTGEYYRFKEGIRIIDPKAFFTVVDAYEVLGGE